MIFKPKLKHLNHYKQTNTFINVGLEAAWPQTEENDSLSLAQTSS